MKLTPVILLALVPLLILTVAEAAKGKENAKLQSKSASAAAAGNGKSAKQSAAKSAGNTAKTASDASKAVPVERHFKFEKESKAKKNSRKMKTKQSAQANMASSEQKKSSAKSSSSSNEAKKMFIISKEEQKHLTAPLLSHEDSKKSANQVNLQELAYNAKASSHQHQEAAKSKASSSHHHEISPAKQQESAKIADAKHGGSKSAPCPNCQTGPFHHQLAVSKSSSAESSSSSADKNPSAKNPSHHHHQKSSSSSSTSSAAAVAAADKSAKEAVKKRNHYQHYLHPNTEYGQQPAYLTNAVYHQQVPSKPAAAALYNSRPHSSYQHHHHNLKPVSYSNSHLYSHHHTNQYGHNDYQQQPDTLIQANVISRLGDRTPFWLPRNDYYKEKDFPEGLNQLINVGKERLVNYGRVLRERYHNLINNLRLKDISTQSAADRVTVDSALALLAGLLPPTGDQVWSTSNYNSDELARLWQPVAVSTVEARRDWKLSTEAPCRTAELVENVTITESVPELRHFLAANREVIRRLEVLTGEDFTGDLSWIWIANLYDTYLVEAEYFGPAFYPPRWADEQTLAVLKQANELKFSVWGHDQAYLRLRGGPLLQEITDNLIRAAKDEAGGRSLAIYSTFDTNIAIIEHSLGIFRGGQAGYGSGLLIELHRDNNSHYNNNNYNHRGNEPVVAVFSVDVPSGVKISQVDLSRSERFRKHCYSTGPDCPLSSFAVALQHHLLSLAEAEVKCNND